MKLLTKTTKLIIRRIQNQLSKIRQKVGGLLRDQSHFGHKTWLHQKHSKIFKKKMKNFLPKISLENCHFRIL